MVKLKECFIWLYLRVRYFAQIVNQIDYKMVTKLKPIFIKPSVKKVIELNASLKGITTRNDSLVDMLKESPRYNELIDMLKQFNTPKEESDINENS